MEDVRILEEQQRQADQKLDSAKRYKEQCTQHQQQVETTLSTLKYENGKNAELIQQQRITLQQCGRELGTLREEDTRADNDLRKFHDKLKKATACCRKIVSLYTQIDRATILLRKKETDQRRVLADAEDKAREAETRYAETVRHEELVLKAIQAGKQTANVLAEESAKAESNCAKLDNELATHRKMESASAASLQEAEEEVKAEKKRGEEAQAALRAKIADAERRRAEMMARLECLEGDEKEKQKEVDEAEAVSRQIQLQEEHEVTPEGMPVNIDVSRIRAVAEKQAAILEQSRQTVNDLVQQNQTSQEKITAGVEKEKTLQTGIEERAKILEERQEGFVQSRAAIGKLGEEELQEERNQVDKIQTSYDDVVADKESRDAEAVEKLEETTKLLEEDKVTYAQLAEQVEAKQREKDELEDEYEKKKAAAAESIALAEAGANEANAQYEALKEEEAAIDAESPEAEAEREMAETIRGGELLMEDGQKEIDEALEEYPVLAQLTVGLVRDPTMTEEDQKDQILAGLRESCEERVLAAEQDYKQRVEKARLRRQQAKDERVRREAEEREAEEARRAEEEARRRRERKEREARRREQERLEREEREEEDRRREKEASRARKEAKRAAEEQRRREEE